MKDHLTHFDAQCRKWNDDFIQFKFSFMYNGRKGTQ
jgi:hypothetical protein